MESLSFSTVEIRDVKFLNSIFEISRMTNDLDSSQVLLAQQSMIASQNSMYPQSNFESKISTNVLASQRLKKNVSLFNGIPDFVVLINEKNILDPVSISFDDQLEIRKQGWTFLKIISLKFYT